MDKFEKVKLVTVAVFTALSGWMGILAIPVYIMVALNIADYITGLYAAKYRGENVNSYKGFNGIAKKIGMWILVGLGAAVDWLLMFATDAIGLEVPFAFLIASLVAIWIIANEIISILENLSDIGVDFPPFLLKVVTNIKDAAEEKADAKRKETGAGNQNNGVSAEKETEEN